MLNANSDALHAVLRDAVAQEAVPFVVAMLGSSHGIQWSGAAGNSLPGQAASARTVFHIASMTKILGAVATMRMVERGLLTLDTEVRSIIADFEALPVVESVGPDGPVLREQKVPVTVRHLATHTSGLVYEFWNPDVGLCLKALSVPGVMSGQRAGLNYPLMFDAGTQWGYGIGVDWLGLLAQTLDGRPIDQFCRAEILDPLGMCDTLFEPVPEWGTRLAGVYARTADGHFRNSRAAPPPHPEIYGLGHALFSTAPDYMRLLCMLLNQGMLDGQRILQPASVQTLLANHTGALPITPLRSTMAALSSDVDLLPGTRKSHSLACMRFEDGMADMRGAGSQGWAGILNTHYWIDPSRDVAAVFMTQSLPFADARCMQAYTEFEKAVYRSIAG